MNRKAKSGNEIIAHWAGSADLDPDSDAGYFLTNGKWYIRTKKGEMVRHYPHPKYLDIPKSEQGRRAWEHVENARLTLLKSGRKAGVLYNRGKAVKTAGQQAYTGVLIALDAITGPNEEGRSYEDYRTILTNQNKRVLRLFEETYELLYRSMGQEGCRSVGLAQDGLRAADELISWIETKSQVSSKTVS